MELTAMFGSIGLCVGAIVAAAVIYFVVTAIKGKRAERKERAMRCLNSIATSRANAHRDSLLSFGSVR